MTVLGCFVLAFVCLASSSGQRHQLPNQVQCQEGKTQLDQCRQRCKCIGGRLVQCVRIRKEFTSLSPIERKRHIEAIIKYTMDPKYRPEYEDFINEHYTLFRTLIHEKQHFLPWHRYFVLRYENLIRKVDCTFTVAWWDWSLDTREPFSTADSDDVWHALGYGGNGVGKDHCVQSGPFRQAVWSRVRPPAAGPGPHCLVRDFYGEPPEEVDVEEVLKNDSFHDFEDTLRLVLHNGVHCNINGTMCSLESASAPEFFLHHGFVDKIWDDWQKKSHKNKHAYFSSIEKNMPGTNLKPSELIDLSKQPGNIRVEYEPFKREENLIEKIKGESIAKLRKIRRRAFQGLTKRAIELFQLTKAEVKRVREIEKWLDPHVIEPKD